MKQHTKGAGRRSLGGASVSARRPLGEEAVGARRLWLALLVGRGWPPWWAGLGVLGPEWPGSLRGGAGGAGAELRPCPAEATLPLRVDLERLSRHERGLVRARRRGRARGTGRMRVLLRLGLGLGLRRGLIDAAEVGLLVSRDE